MAHKKERIAHTLKDIRLSMGMAIAEIGWGYRDKGHIIQRELWNRKQNIIVFFLGGKGKFESASTGLVELKPGDLFIIPKGIWHRYGPELGEEWYEFWMVFEGIMAENLVMNAIGGCYDRQKCTVLSVEINQLMLDLFEMIFHEAGNNNARKCAALFFEILQMVENQQIHKKNTNENSRVWTVVEKINENPIGDFDFREEAAKLKISYPTLRKEFLRTTHMPPYKFLLSQRMQFACHLLANGKTVKETCYEINMSDPSHFSKLFKKIIGMSPKKFVERIT